MNKRKLGKNRGVWCGTVISELEFSHEIINHQTEEIIETFYNVEVEAEIKNKDGETLDKSIIPVTLSETKLLEIRPENDLSEKLKIGDIVFLKGSWRTYDHKNGVKGTRLEQNAFVKIIEVHEEYPVNTRNKFDFEGVLVNKIWEIERDEDGNLKRDENGRFIYKLDEDGNKIPSVRKNKEGQIVNDFIVAINRPNGSDYIPSISYRGLARYIAKKVPVGAEIKGSGFIRSRKYKDKSGIDRIAYEAVINKMEKIEIEEENPKE